MNRQKYLRSMRFIFIAGLLLVAFSMLSCDKKFGGVTLPLAVNNTRLDLPDSAGSTHVLVYSTGNWNVDLKDKVDWITFNKHEGNGNSEFILYYEANDDTARSAVIIISRDTITRQIIINQAAGK